MAPHQPKLRTLCATTLLTLLAHSSITAAQVGSTSYNGQTLTPAMGWDNWNAFGCTIDESLILGSAQKIVDNGLRDLGYNYIILDDCWSQGRNASGYLEADATKFPHGMKYLSDRLHAMGLKMGMYSSAGVYTCGRFPGSLGFEKEDAESWAGWGVDYIKYDNCYSNGQEGTELLSFNRFNAMSKALNATGRPIVYGLCNWGTDHPWNWATTISNSWRMSGDVYDNFDRPDPRCPCAESDVTNCPLPGYHCSVMNIINKMAYVGQKSISGAVNDMDMLEVGNGGMTDDEYKVHFSLWALNVSPLIMGTDVRNMSGQTLSIYSNPAVIALNQDPSVGAGTRLWSYDVADKDQWGQGQIQMWVRTLSNNDIVVAMINAGNEARMMNSSLAGIFLDNGGAKSMQAQMGYDLYDLWGYRMDNATAMGVLNGTETKVMHNGAKGNTMRYNATAMSYEEGLSKNVTALMGEMVGSVKPMGMVKAMVPSHGVALYRMRANGKMLGVRDEL